MNKEIYPIGAKVRVTKDHDVTWAKPWPKEGDVVTVVDCHRDHSYGYNADIYVTENGAGEPVLVREDYIKAYVEPLPEGTLVFVKETHSTKEGKYLKVYAGDHLTIVEFSKGSDDVPAHYWCVDATGDYRALLPDKIALVEFKQATPPVGPSLVGEQGDMVWHEKGTDLEGYWEYSTLWGWSNFVATNPQRYRKLEVGQSMLLGGVLAHE